MSWPVLIPLIAQYGVPWVYQLYLIVTQHPEPTDEAWMKLLALSQKPILEYINEARAKIGLPPLASYDPRTNPGAPSWPYGIPPTSS